MDEKSFAAHLAELAEKYLAAQDLAVALEPDAALVRWQGGSYRFAFRQGHPCAEQGSLLLAHWRAKRRYAELRNIVEQGMIGRPLAVRIHHIVPKDSFFTSLDDLIAMEADLLEFLCGQKVDRVFADTSGGVYANCIVSTTGGVKASMELGFSPAHSEPVLLHEVVGKAGIASDVAVDTQTRQYPIYVFKGPLTERYNDVDEELYGVEDTEADCIRFILSALTRPEELAKLEEQKKHLAQVCAAVRRASGERCYTKVEG